MNINFYNFSKKENSTATPTGEGTVIACTMKTPASLQAPIVELTSATPPTYNYAHIPDLGRYYFVTGVTYNRGIWEVALRVDVLASFKTDIGSTSMYFERSSAQKNGNLVDNFYPATAASTVSNTTIASGVGGMWTQGKYVVTILDGDSNTGNTSYLFLPSAFGAFIQSLMVTGSDMAESIWDSLTQSIKVTNYEPLKYIGACYWFPNPNFTPGAGASVTSIKMGNFTATGFTANALDGNATNSASYTISIPAHPQAATRGSFCNLEPFSEYSVNLGPFGNIKLDSTAMAKATSFTITIKLDPFTGKARAMLVTNLGTVLANLSTQWGVPVMISSGSNVNVGGRGQSLSGLVTMGASAFTENITGTLLSGGHMISGIADIAKGTISSVGASGAMVDHQYDMTFNARFFTIADDDNANNGRPYCAVSTPATLTGYMVAQKGLVASAAATRPELDAVNTYMEEGFYYE